MRLHVLEFDAPATAWVEGLPVGNGRTGAMCLGDGRTVRLQINDDSAWSGGVWSQERGPLIDRERAADVLGRAREDIRDGRYERAGERLKALQHRHTQAYLPFADLEIAVETDAEPEAFARRLDLDAATHRVTAALGAISTEQSTWVSAPHGVLVHDVQASAPVDLVVRLSSPLRILARSGLDDGLELLLRMPSDVTPPHDPAEQPIEYSDAHGAASEGCAVVRVQHDGTLHRAEDGALIVRGATRLVAVLATATTFTGAGLAASGTAADAAASAGERVARALRDGVEEVRRRQLEDHRDLYRRAELVLGEGAAGEGDVVARLRAIADGPLAEPARDPALIAQLFHLGRYLLICSSRPGSLPATLQGIWNDSMRPPWSSNYTTNINLQMNYWAVDTANLAELAEPLLELVEAMARTGRATAERLYGARGWVAHHNTDAWAYTPPVGHGSHEPMWAFWPMAGLWLARHFVDRLAFHDDPGLRRRALALHRSATLFVLDWLTPTRAAALGTSPSTSPENTFAAGGVVAQVAEDAQLDVVLVRDHLRHHLELAAECGDEDELLDEVRATLRQLPEGGPTPDGRLPEWLADFEQPDPHHRHVSPLLAVYPGDATDPALLAAASRFLDDRGDEATGWSLAWKMALRARMGQADGVDRLLRYLFREVHPSSTGLSGGVYANLLAAHPPFQIDGNLGAVAAVVECLLQSHTDELVVLPALPAAFGPGRARGLVARPGVAVSLAWTVDAAGSPATVEAELTALGDRGLGARRVRFGGTVREVVLEAVGAPVTVRLDR